MDDAAHGPSIAMLFGGIILFLFIMILVVETSTAFSVKSLVTKELNRAANIAIIATMDDEKRKDGISEITSVEDTLDEFNTYAIEVLQLDSHNRFKKGNIEYEVIYNSLDVTPTPPKLEVSAVVKLKPIFIQGLVEKYLGERLTFDIPIEVMSRNQRTDEFDW